jgi:hypothetical protein
VTKRTPQDRAVGDRSHLPPFEPSVPNPARMWNYWLGGKDNISQVVPAVPYSDPTATVQARHAHYSKITPSVVRDFSCTCLGINIRFVGRRFLTLA